MRQLFLGIAAIVGMVGCGSPQQASVAGRDENVGSGLDTGHYVRIGGLKWKRYNLGATALPSEGWEESLGGYFSYVDRAAFVKRHCVNGWRLPTEADYERIRPARQFCQTEWEQTDRKSALFRDSITGITYEMGRAGRRQSFLRIVQGADTLEFPAAGYPARERSVGLNGIYMTATPEGQDFIRVYYMDPSFVNIHRWGGSGRISVRLVKD